MIFATTPSQTVGPYFGIGLPWDDGHNAVPEGTPGAFHLRGTVLDGHGRPVEPSGGLLEALFEMGRIGIASREASSLRPWGAGRSGTWPVVVSLSA